MSNHNRGERGSAWSQNGGRSSMSRDLVGDAAGDVDGRKSRLTRGEGGRVLSLTMSARGTVH